MSAQLTLQSVKTDVLSLDDMVTDLSAFQNRLEYVIWKDECDTFSFDVINLSPVIANTIRRIILDEVPTMAIDTVVVHENSSIIADEIFSHRLGLVPMNIDPRLFEYHEDGDKIHERNTVVLSWMSRHQRRIRVVLMMRSLGGSTFTAETFTGFL